MYLLIVTVSDGVMVRSRSYEHVFETVHEAQGFVDSLRENPNYDEASFKLTREG